MIILPIKTGLLKQGDDLASVLVGAWRAMPLHDGDILAISSKAIATCEGAAITLADLTPSDEARHHAELTGRSVAFCEAVIQETNRLHGTIKGSAPGALLTELKPDGFTGHLLVPNAGLDESNTKPGTAIGWPHDPVESLRTLCRGMACHAPTRNIGLIMTDSSCTLGRIGVTAFALAACGFEPFRSEIGENDLHGRPLHLTVEAIADQLAVAANSVMGNAAQGKPAAVIRDAGIVVSDFCGWVSGINKQEDLFRDLLK